MNPIHKADDIEICKLVDLTLTERVAIERVDRVAFSHGGPEFPQVKFWASGDWLLAIKQAGEFVSKAEVLVREASVGRLPVRLGGLGGVGTLPEKRGLGLAGSIVARAGIFFRDELGVDFGLLVCVQERVKFYSGFGWQVVTDPMVFDQPDGEQTWSAITMVLPCRQSVFPRGTIDLCGLPW